jgi:type VI protein secretion system component VasK
MTNGPRVRKRVVTTRRIVPTWVLWTALVIVVIAGLLWIGYRVVPTYTGFPKYKAWDWLDLIGISSAIALTGWIIARRQRERDETIALEQAQDEALRAYLDQMSNLMVEHKLGKARGKDANGEPEHKVKPDEKREGFKEERLHKRLAQVWSKIIRAG